MSELDCQVCGACCFSTSSEEHVWVSGKDHAQLTPDEQRRLTVFDGTRCFMRMVPTNLAQAMPDASSPLQVLAAARKGPLASQPLWVCAALSVQNGRYVCTVYERRPFLCREFERGGPCCDLDREQRASVTELKPGPPS
jgi:hypothetical protein